MCLLNRCENCIHTSVEQSFEHFIKYYFVKPSSKHVMFWLKANQWNYVCQFTTMAITAYSIHERSQKELFLWVRFDKNKFFQPLLRKVRIPTHDPHRVKWSLYIIPLVIKTCLIRTWMEKTLKRRIFISLTDTWLMFLYLKVCFMWYSAWHLIL